MRATSASIYGGYFSSEDEFPRAVAPYSNERQMIYINLASGIGQPGTSEYDSTIAHEFQHMIHWFWHPGDDSWQNEGMSVLAQHLNNYSVEGMDDALLANPDTMLGGWTSDGQTNFIHYGAGYLFLDYLAQHYGGYDIAAQAADQPTAGAAQRGCDAGGLWDERPLRRCLW